MEHKHGFSKMTIQEFELWISQQRIARTILKIQQHHTFSPSYIHFKEGNHFELQKGMKNYHVAHNGWNNIGQHFTSFPDGTILTGRNPEVAPACIYGNNAHSICLEHLGNFDNGGDVMTALQKDAIVRMTAALCKRFNLQISVETIIYHHWFNLSTGERNNGTKGNKSCPGSNFFEGNKVEDCESNFLPRVSSLLNLPGANPTVAINKYVCVNTDNLNIRSGPGVNNAVVAERDKLQEGAILRVYKEQGTWYKIASSVDHWINGRYTYDVKRMSVTSTSLNVRSGPAVNYPILGSLRKGQEVFVSSEKNGWCLINIDDRWVKKSHLTTF